MTTTGDSLDELLVAAEATERAYADDPGSHTLPPYVQAWDRVLLALDGDMPIEVQAKAAHHGAVAHLQAFRHYGSDDDADIAVQLLTRLRRHAPSPELRFAAVADLATVRFARYQVQGGSGLLRSAVEAAEEALRQAPDGFAHRAALLDSLGNALVELDRQQHRPGVLDRAVALHEEAVAAGAAVAYRSALLVNLATALLVRYRRDGQVPDLERAERLHDEAAAAGADGQQVVLARCEARWERYALTGQEEVLDQVIEELRALVAELPADVPAFATAAGNLANALLERQSRTATDTEAFPLLDRALAEVTAGSPEHARLVHIRGRAHWQRYLRSGDLSRLSAAIEAWQQAAGELSARDGMRPGYLNSVAAGLLQRYSHYHAEDDLRAAVTTARRALRGAPERSVVAPVLWNTLGHTLLTRHDRRGRRRDLDAAIAAWTRAVELTPPQAATRPSYLASLAGGLRERATRERGEAATADLRAALQLHHEAVAALRDSTELPGQLANLGLTLHGLAVHTADPQRYREASDAFARAVWLGLQVSPGEALRAGRAWLAMAMDTTPDWAGAAAAGLGVLGALRELLAVQLTRADQESWLRTSVDVTATTALAHHKIGSGSVAVFVVESGRVMLLGTALTSIRRLSGIHPQLADRYTAVAEELAAVADATGSGRMTARP